MCSALNSGRCGLTAVWRSRRTLPRCRRVGLPRSVSADRNAEPAATPGADRAHRSVPAGTGARGRRRPNPLQSGDARLPVAAFDPRGSPIEPPRRVQPPRVKRAQPPHGPSATARRPLCSRRQPAPHYNRLAIDGGYATLDSVTEVAPRMTDCRSHYGAGSRLCLTGSGGRRSQTRRAGGLPFLEGLSGGRQPQRGTEYDPSGSRGVTVQVPPPTLEQVFE